MGYVDVDTPSEKPPTEYNHVERRAEILRLILRAGHPDMRPTQERLAQRYGVAQSTISRDLDAIADEIAGALGEHDMRDAWVVVRSSIRELKEQGEHYRAAKLQLDWLDWLGRAGHIQLAPERHEVKQDGPVKVALYQPDFSDDEQEEG